MSKKNPQPVKTLPSFEAVVERDTCRFIAGDPSVNAGRNKAVYCGHKRVPGSFWCCHHKPQITKAVKEQGK